MDGFKLIVDQCCTNQRVQTILRVHVFLQIWDGFIHILWIGRNISCVFQCAALAANPVLRVSELTGIFFLPPDTFHQYRMGFLYQTVTQRKLLKAFYGKFARFNVVDDIRHIPIGIFVQKRVKYIIKRRLCTFNLRGQKRFFPHIHGNK